VDLNGDGEMDILSGSYSGDGLQEMAGLFQVLWGVRGGNFKKATALKGTDGKPLIIQPVGGGQDADLPRICTRPAAVDWDGDGNLDIVSGNFEGTFYLFRGEGKGKFSPKSERVSVGDEPLKIAGMHSDPFFVDWDGDGDLDLLSGSGQGGVSLAENTAGKGKEMSFSKFKELVEVENKSRTQWTDEPVSGPASSTRIWADDVNGDGKLDLLVGDNIRLQSPAGGLSKEESQEKLKVWDKESAELAKEWDKVKEEERGALREKFNNLWKKRAEFLKDEGTGFVWVYYQK